MSDQQPEVVTEDLRLARIFFVLPEPISLPDGYQVATTVRDEGDPDDRPDDPEVSLIFHQVETTHGRTTAALEALMQATGCAGGLPAQVDEFVAPALAIQWTVVEAVTPWDSPDPIPDSIDSPGHLTARTDMFVRCLHATRAVVRAYRQATETPCGLPTYVRAISPVLVYSAGGVRETAVADGERFLLIRPTQEEWGGPLLMMLDHKNLPDPFRAGEFTEEIDLRFQYWYREEARENPLNLWRERWIEARRAH